MEENTIQNKSDEPLTVQDILTALNADQLKRFVGTLHLNRRIARCWRMRKVNLVDELTKYLELEEYLDSEQQKKFKLKKKPEEFVIYLE